MPSPGSITVFSDKNYQGNSYLQEKKIYKIINYYLYDHDLKTTPIMKINSIKVSSIDDSIIKSISDNTITNQQKNKLNNILLCTFQNNFDSATLYPENISLSIPDLSQLGGTYANGLLVVWVSSGNPAISFDKNSQYVFNGSNYNNLLKRYITGSKKNIGQQYLTDIAAAQFDPLENFKNVEIENVDNSSYLYILLFALILLFAFYNRQKIMAMIKK